MIDIVSLGEILIDFTPNGTNEQGIALFARNPGGAPANVLAMNSKLGGSSAFIGKVGNDAFGSYLKHTLSNHKIDITGMATDSNVPTTLAFVQLDSKGDRSFSFYRNPGADMMLNADEVKKELIDECKIFHFGSLSLTDEPCRKATYDAVNYAKKLGKIISFDPNYRSLLWSDREKAVNEISRAITMADILKVSEEEMYLVTGETNLEIGSKKLLNMGASLVLVSLGEKGACYRNKNHFCVFPAYKVDAVDTTGAGDAFVGAMLWQLKNYKADEIADMVPDDKILFANAAGGLTATRIGAIPALPTLDEIKICQKG